MRVNVKELAALATQSGHKFEKEGILFIQEKHEGLFRSYEVYVERWCRLRGNILFYFKGKHENTEPAGAIVLEHCSVQTENLPDMPFAFSLEFSGESDDIRFVTKTEEERTSWVKAIEQASYEQLRAKLNLLKKALEEKTNVKLDMPPPRHVRTHTFTTLSLLEPFKDEPYVEISLSCANLSSNRNSPPNPVASVYVMNAKTMQWTEVAQTETLERTMEPRFLKTIVFHEKDVRSSKWVKIVISDVRERFTSTRVPIGEAVISFYTLLNNQDRVLTLSLISLCYTFAGCVKMSISHVDPMFLQESELTRSSESSVNRATPRRRSYSLPDFSSQQSLFPHQGQLGSLYGNIWGQTYCFLSKQEYDIRVREIMADTTLSFSIPHMLLNLYIEEEHHLMSYVGFLKTMKDEYHVKQIGVIERHLQMINAYSDVCRFLTSYKGPYFKASSKKAEPILEFIPINLHLQRMCATIDELGKYGVHDVITVGAFAAHPHRFYQGGVRRLKQELYATYKRTYSIPFTPDSVPLAAEAIRQAENVLSEVSHDSKHLLSLFSQKNCSEILEVIIAVSNKVQKCLEMCNSHLSNHALRLWESMKQVATPKQGDHNEKETLLVDNEKHVDSEPHVRLGKTSPITTSACEVDNLISLNEKAEDDGKQKDSVDQQNMEGQFANCFNSLMNISSDPNSNDGFLHLSSDFEPLDLVKLNIKASLMCIMSKVQNMIQQQQEADNIDWNAEVLPSIQKLQQSLESLVKTVKLTYCIHSLMEEAENANKRYIIKYREDVVFSQALTSLVTALMTRFWCRMPDHNFVSTLLSVGVLAHFEGLLSCYGDEMGMLEDMDQAVRDLRQVTYLLVQNQPNQPPKPTIKGSRVNLTVMIPVPHYQWSHITQCEHEKSVPFIVTPVLFNIGINEQATLAERFGDLSLQEDINLTSCRLLRQYCNNFMNCMDLNNQAEQEVAASLANMLNYLKKLIEEKKNKNVHILQLAEKICHVVRGLRFTSCKSAKDRTAMGVTLEQVLILQDEYGLDEKEFYKALDCMRSEGTRRENTFKNVNVRKYAFNSLQLMTLPRQYRPPLGTYGNVQA